MIEPLAGPHHSGGLSGSERRQAGEPVAYQLFRIHQSFASKHETGEGRIGEPGTWKATDNRTIEQRTATLAGHKGALH